MSLRNTLMKGLRLFSWWSTGWKGL